MVWSPDELRRLQQETLCLHSPIPLLLHKTATDCVLGGYSMPKGSRVMVNVWALGHDRATWKDPSAFRPLRFMPGGEVAGLDVKGGASFVYIPYGSGRRSCPGMALGQYAPELAVAQLAHGFNWVLPEGVGRWSSTWLTSSGSPRRGHPSSMPWPRHGSPTHFIDYHVARKCYGGARPAFSLIISTIVRTRMLIVQ
ncbi:hypothetical protein HU200_047847 [Digitaria exilis]|uniref:Cytochrome P450 n=1 Tax=Digitaria exilis TaxID=1010633 RepID=A0A835B1U1_9POAL|nr:hypothetical protein HU200_047847 [Digitaria exilis]